MIENNIQEKFLEYVSNNNKLKAAITLFRHRQELQRIDAEMENNKPVPTQNVGKFKRALINGTTNAIRRSNTASLSEKKKRCMDSIAACQSECKNNGIDLTEVTKESIKQMADEYFGEDKFELKKVLFAMILSLEEHEKQEKKTFIYGEDTLKDVSSVLFGNDTQIRNVRDNFYENFKRLSKGNFFERNKYILIGAGISLALISVLTPIALGVHAAVSPIITSCLAQIGHCAPGIIGAGIAKVTAMTVVSSALLGGIIFAGAGIAEIVENKKVLKAFRELKPEEVASLLAMKATLIKHCIEIGQMKNEECKKELDECLSSLNDLRSDAEYMLIVEKLDAESSKQKIKICNRFVDRLAQCVGI